MIMLIFVSVNEFRNLSLLPSAKIVEHYDDAAPVIEFGDSRRYAALAINLECMNKRNEMRCFTHKDILGWFDVNIPNDRIYSRY
mgnify:CR=1 FL=1